MFSSEPVTMKPRSRNAAATDPIAVPQMPRKWKLRGAPITRILYAASAALATETRRTQSALSASSLRRRGRHRDIWRDGFPWCPATHLRFARELLRRREALSGAAVFRQVGDLY